MKIRRAGISLTEVLIAMFIMAVGMIALMTLFPLGAMRIGQSLKDDRCTQLALQMDGQMRAVWRNEVVANPSPTEPFYLALNNPNDLASGITAADTSTAATPTPTTGRGYPVLIDPYGINTMVTSTTNKVWVATTSKPLSTTQIPVARRSYSLVSGSATAVLQFSKLLDDYTFEMNGQAGSGIVARQGRYSAAVLLQRSEQSDPKTATIQILVFDGRSPSPTQEDESAVSGANVISAVGKQVRLIVKTRPEDASPTVRRGGWLYDGTTVPAAVGGVFHSKFHRIVAATVVTSAPYPGDTTYDLDLETDLEATAASYQFYFMAGLSEVFDNLHDLGPDPR